jgi:hypothetical protein
MHTVAELKNTDVLLKIYASTETIESEALFKNIIMIYKYQLK